MCRFLCVAIGIALLSSQSTSSSRAQSLTQRTWKVDNVERSGLVYAPEKAKESPTPVVFVFHGHGGSSRNSQKQFAINQAWPEAISVYLQGLNTPGMLTDPEGKKTGWQSREGNQENRDLKFFDTVLEWLKTEYKIDERRIYSTGHSNGGGFTYLLWAERGNVFAAMGPSAAANLRSSAKLTPKPLFHIASEQDPLVKYAWQQNMLSRVRTLNKTGEPKPWKASSSCTIFPSNEGNDVVLYKHDEGHKFPGKDSVEAMVRFFKEHARE